MDDAGAPLLEDAQRQLFVRNPAVQLLIDAETGRILSANPAAVAFYGYDEQRLRAMHIWEINQLPREQVEAAMRLAAGGGHGPFLFPHRLASGEVREVEVHSGPIEAGGRCYLHSLVFDVTERRRTEAALRESEERYRRLVEVSPLAIVVYAAGRLLYINPMGLQLLGAEREDQVLSRPALDFVHPDSLETVQRQIERLQAGHPVPLVEARFLRLDGRALELAVAAIPLTFHGQPAVQMVAADVGDLRRRERRQQVLYRIAAATLGGDDLDALFREVHALVGELMYARNFYVALHDHPSGLLRFPYFVDEFDPPPAPRPLGRGLTEHVLRTGRPLLLDPEGYAALQAQGEVESVGAASVDWLGVPLLRAGEPFGVLAVQSYSERVRYSAEDLELLTFVAQHVGNAVERRSSAGALRESEARFRTLTQTAPCAIVIYDQEGFLYANDAALAVTGRSREELTGTHFWDLVAPEMREPLRERGLARLRDQALAPARYEVRVLRPDGGSVWLDFSVSLVQYEGRPAILAAAFDVSERKRAEEQVRHLAYHDGLTGLPNRLLFRDRLEVAVAQAHRDGTRVAVLFIDLDNFKVINDSMGHSQGDELLREVARRLIASVREGDTVARHSGDEFTLVLPGQRQPLDAVKAGNKLLDVLRQPFVLTGREVVVTASMGIAIYPEDGADAEALVKNSDNAMYRAKERGRDGYQLFAPDMNARAVERLALEQDLRRAFLQDELRIFYQPLYDARSQRIVSVEALLRWRREGRFVPPADFIPVAEVTGLIMPIGLWMLRRVCSQARAWQRAGHAGLVAAVNLSPRQLQQPDLAEQVREVLAETGLEPEMLEFEITETSAMLVSDELAQTLRKLRQLGVRLAIDDFGVGYSSLAHLKGLPVQTLKIDRSFVQGVPGDADDAAIATAVIQMAHALQLQVVAEGVENEAQRAFLAERGCDRMQGFLFSPALPPDQLDLLLRLDGRQA